MILNLHMGVLSSTVCIHGNGFFCQVTQACISLSLLGEALHTAMGAQSVDSFF